MSASRMKRVFHESADCYMNLEMVSQTKKRCRGRNGNEVTIEREVNGFEEHYLRFLELGLPLRDSETERDDSMYLSFLENLREHGNSFILDVQSDHGVCSSLKYEDNDEPSDELKRKTPKSRSYNILDIDPEIGVEKLGSMKEDTLSEKMRSLHVDMKNSDSRKTNTVMRSPNIVENLTASRQKSNVSKHNGEVGCSSSQVHRSNSKAHIVNSSYKVFRSSVTVSERSVFYKYGDNERVYYEWSDQHTSNYVQNKPSKTVHTTNSQVSRSHNPTPTPTPTPSQLSRLTILTPRAPTSSHTPLRRMPTAGDGRDCLDKPSRIASQGNDIARARVPKGGSTRRASTTQSPTSTPATSTLRAPISSPSHIPRMPTAKDYHNGLNKPSRVPTAKILTSRPISPTPRAPTLNPTPIPRAPTANDCHNDSDKPMKIASRTEIPTQTPRVPTSSPISSTVDTTFQKLRDDNQKNRAVFRKKLEISCRRPYEKKELKDLWRKLTARKPKTVHMETRGRVYAKEIGIGKSYLDTYPDLGEEIKEVKSDRNKVLNLLRGFFLYLQCIPSGILPPWKVDDLRKIMLGSI